MIFNFGSINIDHVYRVPHLPKPGETLGATSYERHLGGKGINQSIAIARAGGEVRHIGAVGPDGEWALQEIQACGIGPDFIARLKTASGHAIINVDEAGENAIVIFGGANTELSIAQVEQALGEANSSNWVLLQNETNLTEEIASSAMQLGCKVAYSAAPFVSEAALRVLPDVDLLIVNEIEAKALAEKLGTKMDQIPVPQLLVTLGKNGAFYRSGETITRQPAFLVEPVDTTGAGDTFLGSFLARFCETADPQTAMRYAAAASALQVTRAGASSAIPERMEVEKFLKQVSE